MADLADSYADLSGDNGEGESSSTTGQTRQRRSSTGPWASGNSISSNGDGTELWACPFCKWKPLRYQGCHTYKLKEISRVKQHLRRKHRIPPHCEVCSEEFADEETRISHARAQNCCRPPSGATRTWEGVTLEQQEMLERRAERNKTKVEQWYSIYEILFPGQTLPASPYLDLELSPQMHSFQAFLASDAAATILKEATLAQIPPHMQREEVLSLSRAIFEQAMPAFLQQYEASQRRRPGQKKTAERDDEDGSLSRVSSDTWMSAPPLITGPRPELDDFSGQMDTDDNDLSTLPSPIASVRVAEQHQQQHRRRGINTMGPTTPHQPQHHYQQPHQSNPATPLQQASLWGLQHQSPLSSTICGDWVNETATTQQREEVGGLGNPDMLYCNFDMFVGPYYRGQQ